MDAQNQVAKNTAARGYRDGWTAEQFAARQVAKLAEELGELNVCVWSSSRHDSVSYWEHLIESASIVAKADFDNPSLWHDSVVPSPKEAKAELADIQVVVFNLAAALAEITGEPFDVVQAAVDKSAADVERGVR